ncbi:glycine betaine ABC transporter substrate-binding protein [Candidatus Liberibacter americanus]|uniref:L-proline glycine betaine binding ABC transporter protein ProX n=1 Tax=Candidatus Liberibacter americanus str. Sao Paulo TaxID=1261131 RepID=U6B7L2_9HYPH|nr:glycine betaine ABC transporter substrate-binding protein [Candidatus Liberibacter americanus]AHA27707.1 L-proline glycine betaine binding ABC transporter protein ProX [Candidatus Liberibacter americanus str. Sao Paulo]EMS36414.1 substrate-binding region of ABC-type glycine betaine transport system [Candidatus Liberibacter americanus PW_SP]
MIYRIIYSICFYFILHSVICYAKEPEYCHTVRFSDTGWTDISATTAVTSVILEEILGYKTDVKLLSIPVTFRSLKNKDIDVFMGYWSPSMEKSFSSYIKDGSVQLVTKNLQGAKYMLAVNDVGYELGIRSYQDIEKYKDKLGYKIYGIDPGNSGNQRILDMINNDKFSLKNFKLVEASEQATFSQVRRSQKIGVPIVFLCWEPNPINLDLNIHYLSGGDDIPGFGEAVVYTVASTYYLDKCYNVATLLKNIKFTVAIENEMMQRILKNKKDPKSVGRELIRSNINLLNDWLVGVKDFNGHDPTHKFEQFIRN